MKARLFVPIIWLLAFTSTVQAQPTGKRTAAYNDINAMLDSFNVAAARADYTAYFNFYTEDAIFIGTDATERWTKTEFMQWAKPYFDKKRTWDFSAIDRHIYFSPDGSMAWFDELLNTQMKICRGSGVVVKEGDEWKLKQYVLSTTVPNNNINAVIKLKAHEEDSILQTLKQRRIGQLKQE